MTWRRWLANAKIRMMGSDQFDLMFTSGVAQLRDMRWAEATLAFELCVQLRPESGSAWANLAIAYFRLGQLGRALGAAHNAVAREPKSVGAWVTLSEARRSAGQLQAAVDAARRAARLQPDEPLAHSHLALSYHALGEHEKALAAVRRAKRWARGYDPLLHVLAGDSLLAIDKLDAALREYETVIENEGKMAPIVIGRQPIVGAWEGKAFVHLLKGLRDPNLSEHEQAVAAFERAIELDVRNPNTWAGMGAALRMLGRFESSLDAIDRAIRMREKDSYLALQRGLTLVELDRNDEGFEELTLAAQEAEDSSVRSEALTYRPIPLLKAGRLDQCIKACDEAVEAGTDNAIVRNTKGCTWLRKDQLDKAELEFDGARQLAPDDPVVMANIGNLARLRGQYAEADRLLDSALARAPRNPAIWVASFLSLRDQDRREDAQALVTRARAELANRPKLLQGVLNGVEVASLEKSLALAGARIGELEEELTARHVHETPLTECERRLEAFEALLARGGVREEQIKQYLKSEASRFIFGLQALRTHTEHELGSDFRADFVLEYPNRRYVMVEVENPRQRLYTSRGKSGALAHACQQVEDWQHWIEENNAYAQRKLSGCVSPEGLVIIGRASTLTERDKARLGRSNINTRGRLTIRTYDDLLEEARAVLSNLRQARSGS